MYGIDRIEPRFEAGVVWVRELNERSASVII